MNDTVLPHHQGIFQDLEHGGVSTNPWGPLPFPSSSSLPFPFPSLPYTSRPSLFPFLRSRAPPLPSHFPLPFSSLRSRAPKIQLGGLGERCKLPRGVWGRAPAEIEFSAF